jgi:formaldehyde-activating enzyme
MYLVGEALIGDGAEIAHIDLFMGDKEGPVGTAFAGATILFEILCLAAEARAGCRP